MTRLPRYARGLKLVRIGVFVMLAQLVLALVMTLRALAADDAIDALTWIQYIPWANMGALGALLIGSLLALPDFRLARQPIGLVPIAEDATDEPPRFLT